MINLSYIIASRWLHIANVNTDLDPFGTVEKGAWNSNPWNWGGDSVGKELGGQS